MIRRALTWLHRQVEQAVSAFLDGYRNGTEGVRRQWAT